jgi:hypothetical protein
VYGAIVMEECVQYRLEAPANKERMAAGLPSKLSTRHSCSPGLIDLFYNIL